jgi:hypothetical protein
LSLLAVVEVRVTMFQHNRQTMLQDLRVVLVVVGLAQLR